MIIRNVSRKGSVVRMELIENKDALGFDILLNNKEAMEVISYKMLVKGENKRYIEVGHVYGDIENILDIKVYYKDSTFKSDKLFIRMDEFI